MCAIATPFKSDTGQTSPMAIRIQAKRSAISRFRHLIEFTDWEEKVLAGEKWMNRIFLIFLVLSMLYLIPTLALK
ncbi:MAG: hypothetical protein K4571_19055 [Deltaproteobacteria bacterium]